MNCYRFEFNEEMKKYLKRNKDACIHFCGKCWVRLLCSAKRKECKANKKETCAKCSGEQLTDKELEKYF